MSSKLKVGNGVKVGGRAAFDNFAKEITIIANTVIEGEPLKKAQRMDNAEVKRVELHMHTQMSQMDAVTPVKDLIKRAVSNLIQNSINHNENGCTIYVAVKEEHGKVCKIVVSDNGVGATDEQIDKLNNSPHYMVCDENTSEQRHGLGLLIVKQIAAAHKGTVEIKHSEYGGLEVEICLPV